MYNRWKRKSYSNSHLLGEKGQEKYFYVQSISTKKLSETIYSIKEHCPNYSCHIITPQEISLKEADSALLEKHRCRITNLDNIIKNNFRIKTEIQGNISLSLNANTRSIILYNAEIFFDKKLQLFKFIYELSKTPLEKVSCEILSGYKKSHSYDKAPAESARKTKERLLKFLNTSFLNQEKDISILKELITSFNQEGAYCLNMSPDKISITGSFQK